MHFDTESVVSDVTGDGDGIPMTTAARSWGGGSGRYGWLKFVLQGAGPMAPPIRARLSTVVFFQIFQGIGYIWIVYTRRESLLHLVLACLLAVLCDCSSCDYLQVCVVGDIHQTVPQDYIVDAMASQTSQPGAD